MAEHADGSIIVDTEIDAQGFKAGSSELLAAIKSLSNEVKNLGQTLKETFSGNDKNVGAADNKIQMYESTIASLQEQVQSLQATVTELQGKLNNLGSNKNVDTPVDGISETAQVAGEKIATLEGKIKELNGVIADMQTQLETALSTPSDVDFNTDAAEAKITSLENKITELENTIAQLQSGNDTSPQTTDFGGTTEKASSLQHQVDAVKNSVERLQPTFQRAMGGSESAMTAFIAKSETLENAIAEIETKMQNLGSQQIPTDDYQWLTTEINKAEAELDKLINKQMKMESLGVKQNSQSWKSLQYDIDLAKRKITEYKNEQATMRNDGTAFQMGVNTAPYKQLEVTLVSVKNKLAQMRAEATGTSFATSRLATVGNTIRSVFSRIGTVGKKAFTTLGSAIKGGIAKLRQFTKQSNRASFSMRTFGGRIRMMGMMIKQMLVMRAFMGILTAIGDGFKNLSQYSTQTNSDLSTLKSSLTQLKNSFATAFAPILTAVTPILATLINYLSSAITHIGMFVAALTGAKTFTKATAVQEDYAASLNNTASAAKEAKRWVAGFDELNVRSDTSTDSGGGSVSPSEMFEEVPIESRITDFVDRLKEAFKNGDYAGIGAIIGNGINTAVQKINDFISWDNVGAKITNGIKGIAQCFNSLVDTVDWENIGDTIAQGFNTVVNTLYLIITEFDWPALAAGFARSINGLIQGVDWKKLAKTLSKGLSTVFATLSSFISTIDWASLGESIATFILNVDWKEVISNIFRLLGAAIGGCAGLVAGLVKTLWGVISSGFSNFWSNVQQYCEETGANIIEGIFVGIGNALKNIGTWILENIWNPFIEGFKNAFGIHSPSTKMAEMGVYIVEGLLNGIKSVWNNVIGFFSTTFENIKNTILTTWENVKSNTSALWNNITSTLSDTWDDIKSDASTTWTNLKTTVSNGWDNIKSNTSTAWNNMKTTLSTTWSNMKSSASTTWANLKTTISNGWNNIKSNTSTTWNSIRSSLVNTWSNVKSNASTSWSNLKTTISNGWNNIKSNTNSTWNGIKSSLSSTWDNIRSNASSKWEGIKNAITNKGWSSVGSNICSGIASGIDAGWSWLKNKVSSLASSLLDKAKSALGIHSPSRLFRDIIGLNIGYGIGEGIEASESSVVGSVTGLADAIAAEANAGEYNIGGIVSETEVDGALSSFSDKVADNFSALLERLQAIAKGVTFTTPAMATGSIVPYKVAANTVTDSHSGNSESFTEFSSDVDERLADLSYQLKQILAVIRTLNLNIDLDALTDAITQQQRSKLRNFGGV